MANIYICEEAKDFILSKISNLTCVVGWEFGSGGSTLWWAKRSSKLTSIEHDQGYYQIILKKIKKQQIKNVDYRLIEDIEEAYPKSIIGVEDRTLDYVFIDGRNRLGCIENSWVKIKPGGMLILDDTRAERYQEAFKFGDYSVGWPRVSFRNWRLNPKTGEQGRQPSETSIWNRPE